MTPLYRAVGNADLEIVRILIKAGANVNKPTGWFSPLARAKRGKKSCGKPCAKPYDEIINLLIKSGGKEAK